MPIGNVDPPGVEPDAEPLICVPINEKWIPIIMGALRPMRYPEYWAGTLEENRQVRLQTQNLLAQFARAIGCGDVVDCCNQAEMARTLVVQTRVTIEGHIEISTDGGTTWKPSPTDPSIIAPALPTPLVYPDDAPPHADTCLMAGNILGALKDIESEAASKIGTATTIIEFCLSILTVALQALVILVDRFFEVYGEQVAALIPLIIGFAKAWWDGNVEEWNALWSDAVWDRVLCHIYCNIPDDGNITQIAFNNMIAAINGDTTIDPKARYAVTQWMKIWNSPGINTVGAVGISSENCDACNCGCGAEFVVYSGEGTDFVMDVDDIGIFYDVSMVLDVTHFGGYVWGLTTNDALVCCGITSVEVLEGTITGGEFVWQQCGSAIPVLGVDSFGHRGLQPNPEQILNTICQNSSTFARVRVRFQ